MTCGAARLVPPTTQTAYDEVVAVGAVDAKGERTEGNVKEADVV